MVKKSENPVLDPDANPDLHQNLVVATTDSNNSHNSVYGAVIMALPL